ncbi:MAG: hypothetical protein M3132_14625 [Actinomycetia bacterium]|nr:hypothetical protein [Actinomycetes bacterium]
MKITDARDQEARKLLNTNSIATIDELKKAIGTKGTMTVFRSLSRLGYVSSYSHRGSYYTLPDVPVFDERGLWSCRGVKFSRYGNLLETVTSLVVQSEAGFTPSSLEAVLQVEVKHALLQLVRRGTIARSKAGRSFVYLAAETGQRRRQELMRDDRDVPHDVGAGLEPEALSDELRAGIILFFSLLDEKQRRLFAGLEAAKMGYGGDRKAADLLGLDSHTVATGRQELIGGRVDRGRVRRAGGGDKLAEKKARS